MASPRLFIEYIINYNIMKCLRLLSNPLPIQSVPCHLCDLLPKIDYSKIALFNTNCNNKC